MSIDKSVRPRHFVVIVAVCAGLMCGLSYVWHGVLLNDYTNIRIPMWLYFLLSALVYLLISVVLNFLYRYTHIREMRYRGLLIGASLGFFIYMIAFVLGVSFSQSSATHIAVDFLWQMIEQGIGGASLGLMYSLSSDIEKTRAMKRQ
jgi:hypothetical protein